MLKKRRANLAYRVGNLLMVVAVAVIGFVYYPLVKLYLEPPPVSAQLPSRGTYLTISKIGAQAPIILGVDAFKQSQYRAALEKGIAQAKQSFKPGEKGTIFLFAHSSDLPWRITRYNTVFLRLGELQKNDQIVITKDGQSYRYQVREKKEIWPNEVKYLDKDSKNQLILQTCTPVGTALKRLLVFADPV